MAIMHFCVKKLEAFRRTVFTERRHSRQKTVRYKAILGALNYTHMGDSTVRGLV
jgi:hypothetical protein